MISDYSLKGKNVLVPRGKKHAKNFSDLVKTYGGVPIEIPLIAFRPVNSPNIRKVILEKLHTYDWIIFTSNVTVETFFSFGINTDSLSQIKIATIGEKTEEALLRKGIKPVFRPKEYLAEAFVEEFLSFFQPGMKVLIPKGNLAREYISSSLEAQGANVDEIVIYETFFPETSREKLVTMLKEKQLHILTFTSPSTVDHFMQVVKEHRLEHLIDDCLATCIGPITLERAKAFGLKIDAMPDTYTIDHMLKSIMEKI